jgi:protein phosphatase
MEQARHKRPPILVEAAGESRIGPRDHNEDTVLVRPELQLYAVADGAGGYSGHVASNLAAGAIARHFEEHPADEHAPRFDELGLSRAARRVSQAVHAANREILEIAASSDKHKGMGTTLVALHLLTHDRVAHLAFVGDSRCYRVRERHLDLLSHDHSLANDVLEMRPDLPIDKALRLPTNVITRALGMDERMRVSMRAFELVGGDTLMLCSDGVSDYLEEHTIAEIMGRQQPPKVIAAELLDRAEEAESDDNLSVVVIRCAPGASPRGLPRMRAASKVHRPDHEVELTVDDGDRPSSPEILIVRDPAKAQALVAETADGSEAASGARSDPSDDDAEMFDTMQLFVEPPAAAPMSVAGGDWPYCDGCGKTMPGPALWCPHCGHPQEGHGKADAAGESAVIDDDATEIDDLSVSDVSIEEVERDGDDGDDGDDDDGDDDDAPIIETD